MSHLALPPSRPFYHNTIRTISTWHRTLLVCPHPSLNVCFSQVGHIHPFLCPFVCTSRYLVGIPVFFHSYKNVLQIIINKFDVDLSVTFTTFQTKSRSISEHFNADISVTYVTVQTRSRSDCFTSVINVHKLLFMNSFLHQYGYSQAGVH